jgi:hypothetical protein
LDVTPPLSVHREANPLERPHGLPTGHDGEPAQPGISTTSSLMLGGMGSPCALSPST